MNSPPLVMSAKPIQPVQHPHQEIPAELLALPRSRAEAEEVGSTYFFTGIPCKHGHIDKRRTRNKECKECRRVRHRDWKKTPAGRASKRKARQTPTAKAANNLRRLERRRATPQARMTTSVRKSIPATIKKAGGKKGDTYEDLIGCTPNELVTWLESQFRDGMSWKNYGRPGQAGDPIKRWGVDHIKPRTEFDLADPKQQRECNHFSNLQPLWHPENAEKGNRYYPARALLPFELKKAVALEQMAPLVDNSHFASVSSN